MKIIRQLVITLFILLTAWSVLFSQKQNNIWYFGYNAGLNFNGGVPVAITNGAMHTDEGCSSIADANGNPLFYTDGTTIWNRNNLVMPNGNGLTGNSSSTQAALIVQKPGNSNLYYVFTTETSLNYSIVDMTLDGGLGDVVAGSKNILLTSNAGEKICGTPHANGTDIWVMSHEYSTNGFNAFLVTSTGVSTTPVHSNSGMVNAQNGAYGQMKFSCNGNRIAYGIADQSSGLNYSICVSNFNNSTGVVSGSYSIQTPLFQTYGIEFSPDGNYLYGAINWALTQYNLNAGSPAAVQASADSIGTSTTYPFDGLQLGPDGKIYCAMAGNTYLGAVNSPDSGGLACNFVLNAVSLAGRTVALGLPSLVGYQCSQPTSLVVRDTLVNINCHDTCSGSATVRISQGIPPYKIRWTPGGDTTATIQNLCAGTYVLIVTDQSGASFKDTLIIANPPALSVSISASSNEICYNDSTRVSATPGFASYTWNVSGNDSLIKVSQAGAYYVMVTDTLGCKAESNHLTITVNPLPVAVINAARTQFCAGDSIMLCVSDMYAFYQWNNGDSLSCTPAYRAGNYEVTVTDTNGCSAASKQISISTYPVPVDSAFTAKNIFCNDDSTQICSTSDFIKYRWNVGDTSQCIDATQAGNYYLTVTDINGCTAESNHVSIAVYPIPSVSIIVLGDTLSSFGSDSYQWFLNGDSIVNATSEFYVAKIAGTYTLGVSDTNGCSTISNPVIISGIEELAENLVFIYPNPTKDAWQLVADRKFVGSNLLVFDDNGRIVFESILRQLPTQIKLDVQSGIYWLQISSPKYNVVKKLVKI